jgi:hypothetical protein
MASGSGSTSAGDLILLPSSSSGISLFSEVLIVFMSPIA